MFVIFILFNILILSVNLSSLESVAFRIVPSNIENPNSSLSDSINTGTKMAADHCQNLFKWDKWNCPNATFFSQQKLVSTRETAFVKAVVAAGIAHSITRNCSQGKIMGCSCQKADKAPHYFDSKFRREQIQNRHPVSQTGSENTKFAWGGCSDNPSFATDVATAILDSKEKGIDVDAYVARHNTRVGIQMVQHSLIKKCRCHGISGSCTLQTCWLQIAPFEDISRKLKELHRKSVRVSYNAVQNSIILGNSAIKHVIQEKMIPGTENRLIYLNVSPDYCTKNSAEGYMGTRGRTCSKNRTNVTKIEKNSCRNLCKKCGHSIKRMQKKVPRRCNCTFSWCCEVKCDTCIETVDESYCA